MLDILKFVFSNFWVWCGSFLLVISFLQYAFIFWNRLLRHMNVRRAGWPPDHLDADGDWEIRKTESEQNAKQ